MKKINTMIVLLIFSNVAMSQMQTVQMNAKKLQFDDGRNLPAEKSFIITTEAPATVSMIKMQLSNKNFGKDKVLYESRWKRQDADRNLTAILPNHYKLRSGKEYYFRFTYYRKITENERKQMKQMLLTSAKTYLQGNMQKKNKRIKLTDSPEEMYNTMNALIEDGLILYATKTEMYKPGFSGLIENLLHNIAGKRLTSDSTGITTSEDFTALTEQLKNEIDMMANYYQFIAEEQLTIPEYPTEKLKNFLALNLGYAGIFNEGGFSDLKYYDAPYAGVSFTLGNKTFSGKFWNNSSFSAGIMLKDFTVSDSVKISGPVVNKPLYAAYGYKIFDYLKINAGVAIMEERNSSSGSKSVFVRPFIGLSLELNLWLGINKK